MKKTKKYLETFFEEKDLGFEIFNIDGFIISNEQVIEEILNAPENEQKGIANVIRKIDFKNGDINDYLEHLAQALI